MLQAAPDSTLEATTQATLKLADRFGSLPETDYMWALASSSGGFGGVITKDFKDRDRSTTLMLPDVMALAVQSTGLQAFPVVIPPLPGAGNYGVEVLLKSDLPPEELVKLSQEIVKQAMESNMFMFADTDLKFDLPQARVVVDREKVADLGMDLANVAQELGVLLGGGYVNRFNYFNRSYQVIPQLAAEDRQNDSSLKDLKIRTPTGELIPVSSFASIEPATAPRSLKRFQQQAAIQIFGEPLPIPMLTKEMCLSKMEEIIRNVAGDKVSIDYGGESRQIRNESASLTVTLGFALVLIYLVLSAQFHSFRDPLIVLLGSVPLAISGALALTFVGLTTINIYSQVGLITLVGLVAKNGILIVEFANHLQEQGRSKLNAIREASQTRLRPVLITSAATVLGHFPLVIVEGPGAMARNSIGIVLVAGMLIGTFFTLFVVPSLYLMFAATHRQELTEVEAAQAAL
jgi:multidrug efflux pump